MNGSFEYVEEGQGRKVLLLHGLFGSPDNWVRTIETLAPNYHVLALRLPVHRDNCNGLNSIPQLTEYVKEFIDHKNIDKAALCGNSLGGQIALDFCVRYPERAEKLVLTGSAGLYERSLTSGSLPKVCKEFILDQGKKIFYDPACFMTETMVDEILKSLGDRQYLRFLLRIAKSTRDYYMKETLHHVRVPTLLIWGAQDEVTPPHVAHEFESHIEGAKLVFFDQCGHSPPIEQPERFAQTMKEFIDRTHVLAA